MKTRQEVRLTVRQAEVLLECAFICWANGWLTPDERLLCGAARRRLERVERAKKGNH